MRVFVQACAYNQSFRYIFLWRICLCMSVFVSIWDCVIIIVPVGWVWVWVHDMWHQTGSVGEIRGDSDRVTSQTADVVLCQRIMFPSDKYLLQAWFFPSPFALFSFFFILIVLYCRRRRRRFHHYLFSILFMYLIWRHFYIAEQADKTQWFSLLVALPNIQTHLWFLLVGLKRKSKVWDTANEEQAGSF